MSEQDAADKAYQAYQEAKAYSEGIKSRDEDRRCARVQEEKRSQELWAKYRMLAHIAEGE